MNDLAQALAELHEQGVHHTDPVRYSYINGLIQRALLLPDKSSDYVLTKARQALHNYQQSSAQKDAQTGQAAPNVQPDDLAQDDQSPQPPLAALRALTEHLGNHAIATVTPPDSDLNQRRQQQEQQLLSKGPLRLPPSPKRDELKSLAAFRQSWESTRAQRIALEVSDEAPDNPGPLNQHMLVINTLIKMQQLSPAYFKRYTSYMGSLMWLTQAAKPGAEAKKKSKR